MQIDRRNLETANCWFASDRVAGREDITAFKRRARLTQARWREERGLLAGGHARAGIEYPNGSMLAATADNADANFLSDRIRDAVGRRLAQPEPHQTLDERRLRYHLLSSMPLCFNLFGELHDNPLQAGAAAGALWGTPPGEHVDVRFEFSPARLSTVYTGDRTAFDVALLVGPPDGVRDFIGIETKYHEHVLPEAAPDETTRMPRYRQIVRRSQAFVDDWEDVVIGTGLQQIWRDHLLALAMIQNPAWGSGRYVLVHPARNAAFAEAAERYRKVLVEPSTFMATTIEELMDFGLLHAPETARAFRQRYLW